MVVLLEALRSETCRMVCGIYHGRSTYSYIHVFEYVVSSVKQVSDVNLFVKRGSLPLLSFPSRM